MSTSSRAEGAASTAPGTIRRAMARPLGERAVEVVMWWEGPRPRGPWTLVTDLPSSAGPMVGPPPGYVALAGWAT
jgi:hypothetical protein